MGDTISPVLFQSYYDLQASFPVNLLKATSSDFPPVSSSRAWADKVFVGSAGSGPGAEDRVPLKDHGSLALGISHNAL